MRKRIGSLLAALAVTTWTGPHALAASDVSEKKAEQVRRFGAQTIANAKRALRAELKDPESAQFKDVYANYTEEYDVVACGRVNAKNGFGGYTGFKRFVSSGKSVILEGRDNIAQAWREACR